MAVFKIEIEKTLRIDTETHEVLDRVKGMIGSWSGGEGELVHFHQPTSRCFQRTSPPFAYWRIDAAALDRFGPLPFTAGGKPIRWTWRYLLQNTPTLTVRKSDLPG